MVREKFDARKGAGFLGDGTFQPEGSRKHGKSLSDLSSHKERRYPRIATPFGVWVHWQVDAESIVSRVRDLNVGGVFIATLTPLKVGTSLKLLFSVPEGEIRTLAVVRNLRSGEGMGVEFIAMDNPDWQRLLQLTKRLSEKAIASNNEF